MTLFDLTTDQIQCSIISVCLIFLVVLAFTLSDLTRDQLKGTTIVTFILSIVAFVSYIISYYNQPPAYWEFQKRKLELKHEKAKEGEHWKYCCVCKAAASEKVKD